MKRKRISAVARSMIYLNREPFDRRRQAPETILWIITVQTPLSMSHVRHSTGLSRSASCTPSSVIPVGHSSEATRPNSAKLWRTPTPHPSDPRPATYMVALSALR